MYTTKDLAEALKLSRRRVQEIFKPRGEPAIVEKTKGKYLFTQQQFDEIIKTYNDAIDEETATC